MITTFALLAGLLIAARTAGQAVGWGFQLQSPLTVALLCLVMLGAALNLSGVFEIGASLQGLGAGIETQGRFMGSALTGALAVVVAAPCTAPFMGPALGFALTQPPTTALAVFLALAVGFAAPFVILAFSPALTRRLPETGCVDGRPQEGPRLSDVRSGGLAPVGAVAADRPAGLGAAVDRRRGARGLAWLFGVGQRRRAQGTTARPRCLARQSAWSSPCPQSASGRSTLNPAATPPLMPASSPTSRGRRIRWPPCARPARRCWSTSPAASCITCPGHSLPLLTTIHLDTASLSWTFAVVLGVGILFGLAPALRICGANLQEVIKDDAAGMAAGRSHERFRSVLVISELALACLLLVGAGLLLRSFLRVLDVDLGFDPAHAAAMQTDLPPAANKDRSFSALICLGPKSLVSLPFPGLNLWASPTCFHSIAIVNGVSNPLAAITTKVRIQELWYIL